MPQLFGADERTLLEGMLDWYREGVLAKVDGIDDVTAGVAPLTSATSIAGLVKHLALVEDAWFSDFVGVAHPMPWTDIDWESDPEWEFRTARAEPLRASVDLYRTAVARSHETSASLPGLDDLSPAGRRDPFSYRWVLVHLIEETARHLGHLDILVEQLTAATGR